MATIKVESQTETKYGRDGAELTDQWNARVVHALRNLDDRIVLNQSPLARLAYVERLARERYSGHLLPRGLALRELLIACVERIASGLGSESVLSRPFRYLVLLKEGLSCQKIGKESGLSREHVSRVYRPKALELLIQEFLYTIKNYK